MPTTPSRRRVRQSRTDLNVDERFAVGKVFNQVNAKNKRQGKRKVKTWQRHELSDMSLALLCLSLPTFFMIVRYFSSSSSNSQPSLSGVSSEFEQAYHRTRKPVLDNKILYDEVYQLATERMKPPDETTWPFYERRLFELKSTYGESVEHCSMTLVITDHNLGKPTYDYGPGQPIWFALESIGAFAADSCVLLQTTSCAMKDYLGDGASTTEAEKEVKSLIYDSSFPLFRRLIENGHVRINFLDHVEYNLRSCREFDDLSPMYMNRFFWEKEFLQVDSDLVLIFQAESSLCYQVDVDELRRFAMVGGVWPRKSTPLSPEPFEGACRGMPGKWKSWLHPQRRWKMQQKNPNLTEKQHAAPKPQSFLSEDFPPICASGRGPIGHGELSLRSREWMIRAIDTCPHTSYSGLDTESTPFPCKVFDRVSEDFYFGTVLAAMGAPLPSAYEASLFVTHSMWPEEVSEIYGFPTSESDLRNYFSVNRVTLTIDGQDLTIPNVVYKPWWYQPNELLRSKALSDACPFLSYTFTPAMSRFDESKQHAKQWTGVGI